MNKTGTQLARVFFDAGDFEEALRAADRDPDPLYCLLLKASAYFDAGDIQSSAKMVETLWPMIEAAPPARKAQAYGQRAAVRKRKGDLDSASTDYDAVKYWATEADDPLSFASAQNNQAKIYSECGRIEDALAESDEAIRTVTRLDAKAWLGRFLDQRAQILYEHDRFAEAVDTARQAVEILEKHGNETTLTEAQSTYGKALVRLGSSYLTSDSIDGYRARKEVGLTAALEKALIEQALKLTDGHVYRAAKLLDVSHSYVIKIAGKKHLTRKPQRTRHKSYAVKEK